MHVVDDGPLSGVEQFYEHEEAYHGSRAQICSDHAHTVHEMFERLLPVHPVRDHGEQPRAGTGAGFRDS